VVGLSAALAASCNRSGLDESTLETNVVVGEEQGRPQLITADGCLTASGDRFVLTELQAEEGSAEAYRLVGRDEDLRALVGKRVQISGEAEPEQIVDIRQSTEGPAAPATGTSGTIAEVDTTTTSRIEVHDLRVRTIAAIDEPCPSAR
jgi:hypothetical protein